MRPETAAEPTRDQRVEDIEDRYRFVEKHESCSTVQHHCWSALAFIDSRSHQLALEYLDWRADHGRVGVREDLSEWSTLRFGAPLYRSAYGRLMFVVLWRAFPNDDRFRPLGPPPSVAPSGLPMPEIDRAVRTTARTHEMPRTRLTERQHSERVYELQEQAKE